MVNPSKGSEPEPRKVLNDLPDGLSDISRRSFLKGAGIATGAAICTSLPLSISGCAFAQEPSEVADLFFQNGTIYTADGMDTIVEALAVKEGTIIFAGSLDQGEKFKGSDTELIDLDGKLMLPGFFDTHIHSPGTALAEVFDFTLAGVYDSAEVEKVIRDFVSAHPNQDSYLGIGHATNIFTDIENVKGPKKERLDAISADKPITIVSGDGHSMWVNSAALALAGITSSTVPPHGGVIEKDNASGELWGTLKDLAMTLVPKPVFETDRMIVALHSYQQLLNSLGCTSIHNPTMFGGILDVPWEAFHLMDSAGELTLRVSGCIGIDSFSDLAEKEAEAKEVAQKYCSELLKLTGAKFFADGIVNGRTAFILEPYNDRPDSSGIQMWEQDKLNEAFAKANEWGLQTHTHAFGDAAVRAALDACEYANRQIPGGDFRNTIAHMMLIDEKDIPRFNELGVLAAVEPFEHFRIPHYTDTELYSAVGERVEVSYPVKTLHDSGAVVSFSSDCPVVMIPNPLVAMQAGVTRNMVNAASYGLPDIEDIDDPRFLLNPGQRLSVQEMVRGFTINGAYTTFSEDKTGSLEEGKAADLVILDQNILEVDPLQIEKTTVLQTYLEGKLVFDSNSL